MKFTSEVVVGLPLDRVVELFDDTENRKEWQAGLLAYEHLEGTPRGVGARSRLRLRIASREVEMVETVEARALPGTYALVFEGQGVWGRCTFRFRPRAAQETLVECELEYRFSGALRLIGWSMEGLFRAEAQKQLEGFKAFAEARAQQ